MIDRPQDWTSRILSRHDERRRQGLATVSLIPDDPSRAGRLWAVSAAGRWVVPVGADGFGPEPVLAAVCRRIDPVPFAVAELRRRNPAAVVDRPTVADWNHLWNEAGEDDLATVAKAICIGSVPDAVLTRPLHDLARRLGPAAVGAVAQLLADVVPAVWIDGLAGRLSTIADAVTALAVAAPAWGIGGAIDADDLAWLESQSVPSRTHSLLLTGVVRPPPPGMAIASLPIYNQTETADEETDGAKSEAERRLLAALEADPDTAGLFRLNVRLDFRFGPARAEADLYADRHRLVIEIDGWHHFQSADCYRRDRRKDWAYRQHDFRVCRELAEDVMTDLPGVLDRIKAKVQDCARHQPGDRP